MRLFTLFMMLFSAWSFAHDENNLGKSIDSFCTADAKPESQKLCKAYLRMMIVHAHHIGFASASCKTSKQTEVDCKEIANTEKEIEKLIQ